QFLGQVKPGGQAIVCVDDENVRELLPQLPQGSAVVTYAIEEEADYRAREIELGDRKVSFQVTKHGAPLVRIELSVPGRHNVSNALATVITCLEAGIPFAE